MSGLSSKNVWYPRYQNTDFLQLCSESQTIPLRGVKKNAMSSKGALYKIVYHGYVIFLFINYVI